MRETFLGIFLYLLSICSLANDSWDDILGNKSGTVTICWYPNDSDVKNSRDILDGVEQDLILSFISFLEERYGLDIEIKWNNVGGFKSILDNVANSEGGTFGVSSISITEERSRRVNFSPPYLADIQVLVSNHSFGLANTPKQLGELLDGNKAITIRNTTLEEGLKDIRSKLSIDFEIDYVSNTGELIDAIASTESAFGYVDLTNFLVSFKNSTNLKRQLFFPIIMDGIAMVYPKNSDWEVPVQEYFTGAQFREDRQSITTKYFGNEIGSLIDQISQSEEIGLYEEIMISNREKELQFQEILETVKREKEENEFNQNLLIVLGILGFIGIILLVSNRLKTQVNKALLVQQEIIEQRNEELKKLNDEKNELIKVVAHDLRSPLSNIQGCALMLSESQELNDNNNRKLVDIIGDASNRIKSMISKILDAEAIDSGKRNLQMEIISPSLVIQEIIYQNLDNARKKKIDVSFNGDERLKVQADRFYLAQVIENLLLNAIKFSEQGSKVIFGLEKAKEMVRVKIKDYGPGFTDEDKKKVFKKFAQMSAKPTGGEESVGLGLSIVKRYTDMMEGKISFESEPGKGTEFFIDLNEA